MSGAVAAAAAVVIFVATATAAPTPGQAQAVPLAYQRGCKIFEPVEVVEPAEC